MKGKIIAVGVVGSAIIFSGCFAPMMGGMGGMGGMINPQSVMEKAQQAKQIAELGMKIYKLATGEISYEDLIKWEKESKSEVNLSTGQQTDKFIHNLAHAVCSYGVDYYIKKNNIKEKYQQALSTPSGTMPVDALLLNPRIKSGVIDFCTTKMESYIKENKDKYLEMLGLTEENGKVEKAGKDNSKGKKVKNKK
jgi:hypothetical protein